MGAHRRVIPGAVGHREGLAAHERPHRAVAVELEEAGRHLAAERLHDPQRGLHRRTAKIPAARDELVEQVEPGGRKPQLAIAVEHPARHRLVHQRRHQPDRVVVGARDVDEPGPVGADLFPELEPGAEILAAARRGP